MGNKSFCGQEQPQEQYDRLFQDNKILLEKFRQYNLTFKHPLDEGLGDVFQQRISQHLYQLRMRANCQSSQEYLCSIQIPIQTSQHQKRYKFKMLDNVFFDRYSQISTPLKGLNMIDSRYYSIKLIPFSNSNQMNFKKALRQIFILKKLKARQCPYIVSLQDYFIKEWQVRMNQQVKQTRCIVMIFQPFDASLQEIGIYRAFNKNFYWIQKEFDQICFQTTEALYNVHTAGVLHNDIRGTNFYYSSQKKSYLLGGFSEATIGGKTIKGVPIFKSSAYRAQMRQNRVSSTLNSYDEEIYSLAITLVNALQLMLWTPNPQRPNRGDVSAFIIKQLAIQRAGAVSQILKRRVQPIPIQQRDVLDSMQFTYSYIDSLVKKNILSNMQAAYYLGNQQQFVSSGKKATQYLRGIKHSKELAKVQMDMGVFYKNRNEQLSSYYLEEAFKQFFKSQEEKDMVQAMQCSRLISNLHYVDTMLRIAENYQACMDFDKARPIVDKCLNIGSKEILPLTLQMRVLAANAIREIHDGNLKRAMLFARKSKQINVGLIQNVISCQALAQCYRAKGKQKRDSDNSKATQNFKKAIVETEFALQNIQNQFGSGDIRCAKLFSILGNIYFDMRNYQEAEEQFKHEIQIYKSHVQHNNDPALAIAYISLGNTRKYLGHLDSALDSYKHAQKHARNSKLHNKKLLEGLAVGNQGLIFSQKRSVGEAQFRLQQAIELLGNQHEQDRQFFEQNLRRLKQT